MTPPPPSDIHEALSRTAAALEAAPARVEAWVAYIRALAQARRYADAEAMLAKAKARGVAGPTLQAVEALLNHAWGLDELAVGASGPAVGRLRRAAALDAGNPGLQRNLGLALLQHGEAPAARAALSAAAALAPSLELAAAARLSVSPLAASGEAIAAERSAYADGAAALAVGGPLSVAGERVGCPWYYLPYQGEDDRPLLKATAAALRTRAPELAYRSLRLSRPTAGRRIRIVVVSDFLQSHTIGRLNRGWIERLDRRRFEVVLAHAPQSRRDAFRDALDTAADGAVVLSPSLAGQRAMIEDLAPDLLHYAEIGMNLQTYLLAHSRLAPVQTTSWGHPSTTGLPQIDHFISAEAIEPPDAETAYSERLARLPRLPAFYEAPAVEGAADRAAAGLPPRGRLYGCLQSLFKIHPDFDAALARIAALDPEGHIVLLAGSSDAWPDLLRRRWAERHPGLAARVIFTPRVAHEVFVRRLGLIDTHLDPLHFGSGNTLYEAMAHGTPIVTLPGRFARGRIVAGAYAQMGAGASLVTEDVEGYARRAVAAAHDTDLRSELRDAARSGLFSDNGAVTALEAFFESAVEGAG